MANDVNRLIDMLYERIEDAKSPALKPNMSMVDRDELLDLLDEIRTNYDLSILLSTHDFGTLKRVDKVILLKKQVLVQGPPLLVLSSPEFRAQFPEHGKGGVQG